jgi:hypothetical protein
MGITPHPAPYPDIVMYEHALPISWRVYLRSNGVPIDITGDEVLTPVLDDRVEVAELGIERLDDVAGDVAADHRPGGVRRCEALLNVASVRP